MGSLNVAMAVVCASTAAFECITSGEGPSACLRDQDQDSDDLQPVPGGASDTADQPSDKLEPCSRAGLILLTIIVLFAVVSGGYAVLLSGLLFTYVNEYLGWSADAGTVLVTSKVTNSFKPFNASRRMGGSFDFRSVRPPLRTYVCTYGLPECSQALQVTKLLLFLRPLSPSYGPFEALRFRPVRPFVRACVSTSVPAAAFSDQLVVEYCNIYQVL